MCVCVCVKAGRGRTFQRKLVFEKDVFAEDPALSLLLLYQPAELLDSHRREYGGREAGNRRESEKGRGKEREEERKKGDEGRDGD